MLFLGCLVVFAGFPFDAYGTFMGRRLFWGLLGLFGAFVEVVLLGFCWFDALLFW